ncbi:MAG: energy transducer TonB [Betaproteobacteria bacterium]
MPFTRALLIAIALEAAAVLGMVVNWHALFPPPEPPPMKVEFVKLPEPPPPPPQAPQPPPKPKPPPPKKKPPEPPKPEEPKQLPLPEPEPPPPPPKPVEPPPPDEPPPDKKLPPVKKVRAIYPKDALAQGTEGEVRVRLKVATTGKVLSVEVIESKPPGIFDYAVIKATRQYVFPPGDEEFEIDQVIVFRIEDDRYGPESQKKPDSNNPDAKKAEEKK